MRRVSFAVIALVSFFAFNSHSYAQTPIGDLATVYNTLIDEQTGGAEVFTDSANATVADPGLEFDDYLGLYDADFSANSAFMTLIGNAALDGVPLIFPGDPNPRFDTYYYFFDSFDVTSVTLDVNSGDLAEFATVGIVAAGDLTFANASFNNSTDGMFIQFGPGTDYTDVSPTNPDATVGFSFTVAQAVPEPSSAGLLGVVFLAGLLRRRR